MSDRQPEPQPSFEPSRFTLKHNGHDDAWRGLARLPMSARMVTMPEGPGGKASGGAAERSDTISPDGRDFIRTGFGAAAARAHVEWGKFNADGKLVGLKWAHAKYAMPKNDDAVFVSKATYRNGLGRSDANIDRVYLITLDDIGSKIDLTETTALYRAAGLPPTWTTETSKCNYQLAWAVEGGMSPAQYRAVKTAIKRQSVWGKTDTTAASQLVRLPMGVNGKPGPKAEWRVRAEALGRCYALEELQPLFGQFDAVPDGIPDMEIDPRRGHEHVAGKFARAVPPTCDLRPQGPAQRRHVVVVRGVRWMVCRVHGDQGRAWRGRPCRLAALV